MKKLKATALLLAAFCAGAFAQNQSVTPAQKSTAQQVAGAGVALEDLAPNAPDSYTVKVGDTLWAMSALYLKTPWRWPELWGMNLNDVRNPHRIYPGQVLVLEKSDGRARLRMGVPAKAEGRGDARGARETPVPTVKISPRTRSDALSEVALPTLSNRFIEPFLAEPLIVDESALLTTPRIVATQEGRVLLSRGDRAYVLGDAAAPLLNGPTDPREYRVFRNVTPLKDPVTATVLGYEAQYVGKAQVAQGQTTKVEAGKDGKPQLDVVPAIIDIVTSKEEMRVGDRLLPEPARQYTNFVPRAPEVQMGGRIVSVHGSAVVNAAQNQVVVIDKGTRDGVQVGHVMMVMKDGAQVLDRTTGKPGFIKLPDERNGLLMVFRPFEALSYALILEITDGVKVGDKFTVPQ